MLERRQFEFITDFLVNKVGINLENGPWLCGGAARGMFLGDYESIDDFDLYFQNQKSFEETRQKILVNISSPNSAYESANTNNALTLVIAVTGNEVLVKNDNIFTQHIDLGTSSEVAVQCIKKGFYPTVRDALGSFDFTVCTIATDCKGKFIYLPEFLDDEKNKRLRLRNQPSKQFLRRWLKYSAYGYDMPVGELEAVFNEMQDQLDFRGSPDEY